MTIGRGRICIALLGVSVGLSATCLLLLSSAAQPLRSVSACPTIARSCTPLCDTTAIYDSTVNPPTITMICLNPCNAGCTTYSTSVPNEGIGLSCKCTTGGTGPANCCHLVIGWDDNGIVFAAGIGPCGGTCPNGSTCTPIIEEISEGVFNFSAECE
jgi:hypothetical protein